MKSQFILFYVQSIELAEIEWRSQFVSESLHLVPNFAIFENKVRNIFFPVAGSSNCISIILTVVCFFHNYV